MHWWHRIANALYIKKNRSNNDGIIENIHFIWKLTKALHWYDIPFMYLGISLNSSNVNIETEGINKVFFIGTSFLVAHLDLAFLVFVPGFDLLSWNKIILSNYRRELLDLIRFKSHFKYSLYTFSSSKSDDLAEVVFVLWLAGILLGSSSIMFRYWIVAPRT